MLICLFPLNLSSDAWWKDPSATTTEKLVFKNIVKQWHHL